MQEITYRIYADESVSDGKFFSNFYGRCFSKGIGCSIDRKSIKKKKRRIKFKRRNKMD